MLHYYNDDDRRNPLQVYATIFNGSFGSPRKVWVLLQNIAMLLCIALAVTPAFKMRFWNIGGEGQVLAGALAAAACMICLRNTLPNALVIVCMCVSSILAGALWGFIPAYFKAKYNTNETLFTLMMNYVATQLVAYFVIVWENPEGLRPDRHHQPVHGDRLVPADRQLQISFRIFSSSLLSRF